MLQRINRGDISASHFGLSGKNGEARGRRNNRDYFEVEDAAREADGRRDVMPIYALVRWLAFATVNLGPYERR